MLNLHEYFDGAEDDDDGVDGHTAHPEVTCEASVIDGLSSDQVQDEESSNNAQDRRLEDPKDASPDIKELVVFPDIVNFGKLPF